MENQLFTSKLKLPDRSRLFQILAVIFMMGFAVTGFAQQKVTGKVVDTNGDPLPGASVVVKGTTDGTATDFDGSFSLTVPANAVLEISFTGFATQTITVGNQTNINITLAEGGLLLDEVVVTGYTVDSRRQTTGAVSTVKTRDLTAVPTGNVEQQLQGRVSGLTVITNGQPGTSSIVRVRGFGAFGGNEPLYIVDGVPVGSTDFLSPDDIESTTVLKDAASASIYGARAANGVIVYTTKRGQKKPQPLTISYDGLYGVTTPGTGQEMLTPQEQADWTWTAIKNTGRVPTHPQYGTGANAVLPDFINVGGASGIIGNVDLEAERGKYNVDPTVGPIYQVVRANKAGTDWYDAITRNAPVTRHSLGFSGATENSRYYAGFSLQDQAGILIYNNFKRYAFRINTEFDLSKRVRIGENLQFTYRQVLGQGGGGNGAGVAQDENDILTAFRMPPVIPVYDEFGGYAGTAAKGFNNPRNPVASRDGAANDRNFNALGTGNIYLEYDPIDNLTLRTSIGGGYGNYFYRYYSRLQYENSENNASFAYGEGGGYSFNWVWSNTANYKKKFGSSAIDALVGVEALNTGAGRAYDASGLNPFSTDPNYITLSTVASSGKVVNSNLFSGVNFFSVFGRLNYSMKDKYYVTGVLRRDGSSRFGVNSRYGVFPAISAAWRITGEKFLENNGFIDDLKIRGGWGQMGNSNNVDPNNQFSLFSSSIDNAAYDINGTNNSTAEGFYKSRVGNPDAKWETSTTSNIGFDGIFLDGKLDVILDLWQKKTEDLLFQVPLPDVLGNFASSPAVNIATMENKGIDLQVVNKGNLGGKAKYELTVTGSWLKNEITSLAPDVEYFDVTPSTNRLSSAPTRNQIGYSIASFYGYEVLGLFQNQAEVDAAPEQPGAAPGRFRFADVDGFDDEGELTGVPDGKIDAADRTFIGSPVPKFLGGINFKVSFGNFDVETYMYASLGNKIFNLSKWYTDFYPSFSGAAVSARVKDSWTTANTGSDTPIFEDVSNFSTNTQANSFYVEDGSYLRMQNLSIGYNLPASVLDKLGIQRARLYASTNNVFTVTKYQGLDPGVGGAVDTNFGIDIGNYPLTRSYMFGVSVGF